MSEYRQHPFTETPPIPMVLQSPFPSERPLVSPKVSEPDIPASTFLTLGELRKLIHTDQNLSFEEKTAPLAPPLGPHTYLERSKEEVGAPSYSSKDPLMPPPPMPVPRLDHPGIPETTISADFMQDPTFNSRPQSNPMQQQYAQFRGSPDARLSPTQVRSGYATPPILNNPFDGSQVTMKQQTFDPTTTPLPDSYQFPLIQPVRIVSPSIHSGFTTDLATNPVSFDYQPGVKPVPAEAQSLANKIEAVENENKKLKQFLQRAQERQTIQPPMPMSHPSSATFESEAIRKNREAIEALTSQMEDFKQQLKSRDDHIGLLKNEVKMLTLHLEEARSENAFLRAQVKRLQTENWYLMESRETTTGTPFDHKAAFESNNDMSYDEKVQLKSFIQQIQDPLQSIPKQNKVLSVPYDPFFDEFIAGGVQTETRRVHQGLRPIAAAPVDVYQVNMESIGDCGGHQCDRMGGYFDTMASAGPQNALGLVVRPHYVSANFPGK